MNRSPNAPLTWSRMFLAFLGILIVLPIVSFCAQTTSKTFRYRLTLEVTTPEGPRTGSSVIQIWRSAQPTWLGQNARQTDMTGEGVIVDLGKRGKLFALLTGRNEQGLPGQPAPTTMIMRNLPRPCWDPLISSDGCELGTAAAKADLSTEYIPFLVRFRDPSKPSTVESVDPTDLAARFGPGVSLNRVTVEVVNAGLWPLQLFGMTGEPLSKRMSEELSWLPNYYNQRLDGNRHTKHSASHHVSNWLASGSFATKSRLWN